MPAAAETSIVWQLPDAAAAAASDPFIAPSDVVIGPGRPIDRLHGIAFLDRLTALPEAQLRAYLADNPAQLAELLERPPLAADVSGWWRTVPASQQYAFIGAAPRVVGNLEGVSYAVRNAANRKVLTEELAAIDERLGGLLGRAERDELEARQHMLEHVRTALDGDSHVRRLVALDPTGAGRAVIAVGDVSTADFVSYLVPGMFFGVDAQIDAWADTAETLVADQERWLDRLRPGTEETVAAIAWIGYHTPGLTDVASLETARIGRDALTVSLQGLRAARGDQQPYLSILAHSYGSTAALMALHENDVAVDALALVGSPGSPARTVADLHVTGGNVWVGAADWDPVPASGVFGSRPASTEYGARTFTVEERVDPTTGERLAGAVAHNDYFAPGSASLRNLALIGIGERQAVLRETSTALDAAGGAPVGRRIARIV